MAIRVEGPRQLKRSGSPEWCWQTVDYLRQHMRHIDSDWRQAEKVLDELIEARAWRVVPPDKPYGTLNKMLKVEIGLDRPAIKKRIREAELAGRGSNNTPGKKGGQRSDNVTSLARGNSDDYTIRRLRRDHPQLAQRVDTGELSANAAAIEAGFRKRTKSVPINTAKDAIGALLRVFSADELRAALEEHHP